MIKRFLPTHEAIKQSRLLRWLGPRIHDPLLWHINRRAVARGVAMGVFFGLLIPVAQIPAAAAASLILRGNLWIAAVSTLVSNPFTYAPLYYFAYQLGAGLLGRGAPAGVSTAEVEAPLHAIGTLAQAWAWVSGIGQPLLLGMLVMAVTGSITAYWGAQLFWRVRVVNKWRQGRQRRRNQGTDRPIGTP